MNTIDIRNTDKKSAKAIENLPCHYLDNRVVESIIKIIKF